MAAGDFNSLSVGLEKLGLSAEDWSSTLEDNLADAMEKIGQAWAAASKRRCPVDEGTLRNSISYDVVRLPTGIRLDVGVPAKMFYAIFVEFGTRHIAGGRVLALGPDADITDAQAIKDWPAKSAEADGTTYGSGEEQMPWLRTGFTSIQDVAENLIFHAVGYESE